MYSRKHQVCPGVILPWCDIASIITDSSSVRPYVMDVVQHAACSVSSQHQLRGELLSTV
jgi:hypothetical protein